MSVIRFRKELRNSGKSPSVYRAVDRPEFVVCADGFEWAVGRQFDVGDLVELRITGYVVMVECPHCHGEGRVKGT